MPHDATVLRILSVHFLTNYIGQAKSMSTYTVYNAKTHLSSLIDEACAGEEVIIARGKQPLVKLVPLRGAGQARRFGAMRGHAVVGAEFFEPLPDEELRAWESE